MTPSRKRLLEIIGKFEKAKVLVVGDLMLDEYIRGKVQRISPEAPVPIVEVLGDSSFNPGGALNVAHNIHSLEGAVFPCGLIGRDLYGRMLSRKMRQYQIEMGGVVTTTDRPTTLKTRVVAHSQQVVRFDRESREDISAKELQKILHFCAQKIQNVQAVIIEDYGKGVIVPKLIREIVHLCKARKIPVLVDPKEKHASYYEGVTALTPNLKEAVAMSGLDQDGQKENVDAVGKALLEKLKCEAVLITLGEKGMALFQKKEATTYIPTAAKQVFDVSGAGDTVIATFALALASGANMKEAAFLSNLAAGVVVGKLGTATLNRKELEAVLP
jgi:D-beta-D-heptose 7-phosphate kinase/D-beta-D-heptose 1-phosphate adenosyltransferase